MTDKTPTAELIAWLRDNAQMCDDRADKALESRNIFLVKDCEEERDNYNEAADRLEELDNAKIHYTTTVKRLKPEPELIQGALAVLSNLMMEAKTDKATFEIGNSFDGKFTFKVTHKKMLQPKTEK